MAKLIDNIEEVLANTDTLEFPKMKIDFTNDIEKVLITSDVEGEHLHIKTIDTTIEADTLKTDRIVIRGIDVTDEILELFLKNNGPHFSCGPSSFKILPKVSRPFRFALLP